MERPLVVVDASESAKELLREAGEIAMAMGADLTLLHVTSEAEFEEDRKAMSDIGASEYSEYSVEQAKEGASQFARDLADEVIEEFDMGCDALGEVGDKADVVLATIQEHDCDHVFIAGRKRSPTGKAIFGDAAQKVILNSNVPVTVVTDEG